LSIVINIVSGLTSKSLKYSVTFVNWFNSLWLHIKTLLQILA